MKNLIFCDIDGTILDGSRNMYEVSEKTRYAIRELRRDNYIFIASGRCMGLLDEGIRQIDPSGYVLCNGAYAEYEHEPIYTMSFSRETVEKIKEVTDRHDGFYILETLNEMYIDSFESKAFNTFMHGWGVALHGFQEIKDRDEDFHIAMIGFARNDLEETIREELKGYADVAAHNAGYSFDINVKDVNKGTGVRKVMEYLNVPYENTYCFGDGINDLEMLQSVAHPVIMKNAHPDIRKYGFEETGDVLEDGFYSYLLANQLIKPL